ncbi:unnamed protein product [Didymodactylos carnosus]|uniref:C2H2-type domain-containing protein n=1 Tax=Didymodactylos carnosus TaxID=1234261 RepID=A0A8S2EQ30_9BILA|nr:unnamed protein product [Didymodactylos carnosus]CAF4051786.1 unnamed protein product [Didymodactylos carnosus]
MASNTFPSTTQLTDCWFFYKGSCKNEPTNNNAKKCNFRHCEIAKQTENKCLQWPNECKNVNCHYRHPAEKKQNIVKQPQPGGLITLFWDIENCPVPKDCDPFEVIQRIRDLLVHKSELREDAFHCYYDTRMVSDFMRQRLMLANIDTMDVAHCNKAGAADLKILSDLGRYQLTHKRGDTVVLISGDIDFVRVLSDLRKGGFYVILIYNALARKELRATANADYPWSQFTQMGNVPRRQSNSVSNTNQGVPRPLMNGIRQPPRDQSNFDNGQNAVSNKLNATDGENQRDSSHSTPPAVLIFAQYVPPDVRLMNKLDNIKQTNRGHLFSCPLCSDRFYTTAELLEHQAATNHTSNDVSANHLFESPDPVVLQLQQRTKPPSDSLPVRNHICPKCSCKFPNNEELRRHQKNKGHLFHCPLCSDCFPTTVALQQHQNAKQHKRTITTSPLHANPPASAADNPNSADRRTAELKIQDLIQL